MCPAASAFSVAARGRWRPRKPPRCAAPYFESVPTLVNMNAGRYIPLHAAHGSCSMGPEGVARPHPRQEGLDAVFALHHHLGPGRAPRLAANGAGPRREHHSLASDTVSAIRVPDGVDAREVIPHRLRGSEHLFGSGLGPLNGRRVPHRPYRRSERGDGADRAVGCLTGVGPRGRRDPLRRGRGRGPGLVRTRGRASAPRLTIAAE